MPLLKKLGSTFSIQPNSLNASYEREWILASLLHNGNDFPSGSAQRWRKMLHSEVSSRQYITLSATVTQVNSSEFSLMEQAPTHTRIHTHAHSVERTGQIKILLTLIDPCRDTQILQQSARTNGRTTSTCHKLLLWFFVSFLRLLFGACLFSRYPKLSETNTQTTSTLDGRCLDETLVYADA